MTRAFAHSALPAIPSGQFSAPVALYMHVPFCKQRCYYCDFHTRATAKDAPEIRFYTDDMVLAIRRAARENLLGNISSVYMGGGTPSYLGSKALTEIFYTLSLSMHLTEDVECTMEANPESLTERLVCDLWALGVNRLSIGVQSFQDKELVALGRIHTSQDARNAVSAAQLRFKNVSIDLMCGIPEQTIESFQASLEEAISLGAAHVSVYPLAIEEPTPFGCKLASGEMRDVDADFQADCMELASELLEGAGYERYEVASYAKPGFQCVHNCAYWSGVPYLGLGEGAVSMFQNEYERVRFNLEGEIERLGAREALAEDLMLGMRKTKGIGPALIQSAQCTFPSFSNTVQMLQEKGLVTFQDEHLVPTRRGWLCGNELYGALLQLCE